MFRYNKLSNDFYNWAFKNGKKLYSEMGIEVMVKPLNEAAMHVRVTAELAARWHLAKMAQKKNDSSTKK